jgi:hypothetical protein
MNRVLESLRLPGNFLREGRQFNLASYRANLDLDLVMDVDQTPIVQQSSIMEMYYDSKRRAEGPEENTPDRKRLSND